MIAPVRATSLASRFLLTLLATCILPLLVFGWFTLESVRGLIDAQVVSTFVPRLCADHAQKIEDRLRQVFQSCSLVREIARRALDSEEELAAFEEQIELVPDLLDNSLDLLLLADADGRVAYWADGQTLDPTTRGQRAAAIPLSVAAEPWFETAQREQRAVLLPFGEELFLRRWSDARPRDPSAHHLGLALDVPRRQGAPGALLAMVRWQQVQRLLDETKQALVGAGYASAEAFLVDREGIVRAHTDRARYGEAFESAAARAILLRQDVGDVEFEREGMAYSCGFRRLGNGAPVDFALGIAIPQEELFAATRSFTRVFVAAIGALLLVLVAWSAAASRAIARPVHELVDATRSVARGDLDVHVPKKGGAELGELADSFNRMASELAVGRQRLAAAERERAWAEMARQVAHEIKNPLTPMRMTAQLLLRARSEQDPRADAIAERLARTVEAQTGELLRIASDFRQFAGSPLRQLEAVRFDEFVARAAEAGAALFEAGRLTLTTDLGAGLALVRMDVEEMQRVLVNLLQNAVQARPQGVAVRLQSRCVEGRVVLLVADDGPGVAHEAAERLFTPYFTTKSSGTGLGLAICRRILEGHGGAIRLHESGPHGAVFAIDLPLAAPEATAPEA
jgi:signal transduction histidine kinase